MQWQMDLDAVDDDLESRYLAAKGDEMQFTLEVPGKGVVDGALWCDSSLLCCMRHVCTAQPANVPAQLKCLLVVPVQTVVEHVAMCESTKHVLPVQVLPIRQ